MEKLLGGSLIRCIGLCLFVFALWGQDNAGAVEPYPLSSEQANTEQVQVEKQQIIKEIKTLETQDANAVKEIGNELNQIEEKAGDPVPAGNGSNVLGFILFFVVVIGLFALLYGKRGGASPEEG